MSLILGIESTAHTFGIGIVRDGKILSNVKDTYTTDKGGIIPVDSARHHKIVSQEIYEKALKEARISEDEIGGIAFSQGPGLAPCLLEGMRFAKEIAQCRFDKSATIPQPAHPNEDKLIKPASKTLPLIPVNHCVAHLEIGGLTKAKDPVMLYVSGANTQIISYESGKYRIFGETLDIGVGNFIDNFARYLGLGFPGGPKVQELANQGNKYIELPYKVKGMDIALSGILTNLKQKVESGKFRKEDLCYSLQETVFAMLVETAERALAHTGKKELLLGGGVACNSRLQEMCKIMCKERGAKLFVPSKDLLVDNGAMIAYLGERIYKKGFRKQTLNGIDIKPRQRTDEVEVGWKN